MECVLVVTLLLCTLNIIDSYTVTGVWQYKKMPPFVTFDKAYCVKVIVLTFGMFMQNISHNGCYMP